MVSSSLDKSIKKPLEKEAADPSVSSRRESATAASAKSFDSYLKGSGDTLPGDQLPPNKKIQLMFPKCKPRYDYQYQTSTTATTTPTTSTQDTPVSTNSVSFASTSSSSQSVKLINTQANSNSSFNMNNRILMKLQSPLSPDHKTTSNHQPPSHKSSQFSDHAKNLKSSSKHEHNDNYVETNPFRIGSSNQYFYTPNDSLFDNNNSALAASTNNNSMMHQYHYPPLVHQSYQMAMEDRNYFFEPDEIEHNPYIVDTMTSSINTIPSSIIKTTPPATPPALTTTPVDSSPIGSSRNIWDLSPIKSNTPSRIKTQSPTQAPFLRSSKGSYKKLLASPVPIEEDLETGYFYYNNKKPYYQAPQTDSDSNEPATFTDVHELDGVKVKAKSTLGKSKLKHSESSDYIYAEVKKKEERKVVKSKSGSGIMEYDGSPRRFGTSSNEDSENQLHSSKMSHSKTMPNNNYSSPSPPRPGFPQRVVSYSQNALTKSPIESQRHYQHDEQQMNIPAYTSTSKLIPTTFINSSAYETPQTIHEEADEVLQNKPSLRSSPTEENPALIRHQESAASENANIFQVTSPTEENVPTSTFDYLYEFSETRKVLEEFFKCPDTDQIKELEKFSDFNESDDSLDIQYDYRGQIEKEMEKLYNKQMISSPIKQEIDIDDDNRDDKEDEDEEEAYIKTKRNGLATNDSKEKNEDFGCFLDSASRSSLGDENVDQENDLECSSNKQNRRMSKSLTNNNYFKRQSKNFNYSPDTTDYDSNYGDFDFESESPMRFLTSDYASMQPFNSTVTATIPSATVDLSGGPINNYARYCTSMPVLEDGLSSGHASDNENNNQVTSSVEKNTLNKRNSIASTITTIQKQYQENLVQSKAKNLINGNVNTFYNSNNNYPAGTKHNALIENDDNDFKLHSAQSPPNYHSFYPTRNDNKDFKNSANNLTSNKIFKSKDSELETFYTINNLQMTPPPPAPVPHRQSMNDAQNNSTLKHDSSIHSAQKDMRASMQQKSKTNNNESSPAHGFNIDNCNINDYYERPTSIPEKAESPTTSLSPVWIPRSIDKSGFSPVFHERGLLIPKHKSKDEMDEEEVDTDLETDRLLGHQTLDDGFYDDKTWTETKKHRLLPTTTLASKISPQISHNAAMSKSNPSTILRHGLNVLLPTSSSECCINSPSMLSHSNSFHQSISLKTSPAMNNSDLTSLLDSNVETSPDRQNENSSPRKIHLLDGEKEAQTARNINSSEISELCNLDGELVDNESPGGSSSGKSKKDEVLAGDKKKKNKNKEGRNIDYVFLDFEFKFQVVSQNCFHGNFKPSVLIEGVLFRARYLGSTQLVCEGQPTKSTRMMQAEEAVSRIKALAPDGENQPSTEVDLFISTEKIMVLNTDLKEIMMDHALRTISYIADIGDLVVLMARRRFVPQDIEANSDSGTGTGGSGNVSGGSGGPTPPTSGKINRTPKMICHVFESEEAQFIAQSIGQAFQVAYMEFLKANGIEDHSFMKEMDYQEVLNSQEIFGDELEIFAKKELQKEVVVPKAKGEILGVVIVESGWGSMLPTVVIANLASNGAAARCGQLNIGDQIIAINGLSLVGLPLSQCQTYIKNTKNQTVVKFTVVPCAPVVEVKIKRPNTKYQLGFSVQNGVICSLLRGGIAERGGVRVGHRIIEINNQSVVAVPHEKIVNLLATSVGEILMKTMPTSMFRLLTGQENPIYI